MKYTTTKGVEIEVQPIELAHTGAPKYVALRQVIDAYAEFEGNNDTSTNEYWEAFENLRKALEHLCSQCGVNPADVSIGDSVPLVSFWNSGTLPENFTHAES